MSDSEETSWREVGGAIAGMASYSTTAAVGIAALGVAAPIALPVFAAAAVVGTVHGANNPDRAIGALPGTISRFFGWFDGKS